MYRLVKLSEQKKICKHFYFARNERNCALLYLILLSRRTRNAETVSIREHHARVRTDLAKSGSKKSIEWNGAWQDVENTEKNRNAVAQQRRMLRTSDRFVHSIWPPSLIGYRRVASAASGVRRREVPAAAPHGSRLEPHWLLIPHAPTQMVCMCLPSLVILSLSLQPRGCHIHFLTFFDSSSLNSSLSSRSGEIR